MANGDTIYSCTTFQGMLKSTDNGLMWSFVNNGIINFNIKSMAADGGNILAGCWERKVLFSTNNGQDWQTINSDSIPYDITAVAISNNDIFVGTDGGKLLMSSDTGHHWSHLITSNYSYIKSIKINNNNIYVGTYGNFYVSNDYGISWHSINIGTPWCDVTSFAIQGNTVFAGTYQSGIYSSTNNDTIWTPVNTNLINSTGYNCYPIWSLVSFGDKIIAGSDSGRIFTSNDFGQNWLQFNIEFAHTDVSSITTSGNFIFAGTNGDGVFLSLDSGLNWIPINYGLITKNVTALIVNNDYLFAGLDYFGIWERQLSNINIDTICGNIYLDNNNNGIRDSNEIGLSNQVLETSLEGYYTNSDSLGNFTIYSSVDFDTLIVYSPSPYAIANPEKYIISHSDTGKNFGIFIPQNIQDLRLILTNITRARPGFDDIIRITYTNQGSISMNGYVKLVFPNNLFYISSNPIQNFINSDTLIWNFTNLSLFESRNIDIRFNIPSNVPIGNTLIFSAYVYPIINDTLPVNNINSIHQIVTGSYDPNEKTVDPPDGMSPNQITNGDKLVYTIYFQNTGTDTAFTIKILDTLDANIYIPSFEVLSASHPYSYMIREHGIVEFTFNNILLPDSNINESLSQGFIKYTAKPKTSLQLGEEIHNTAYIYFDFNSPIVTNTTNTSVQYPLLISQSSIDNGTITIYPNPVTEKLTIESNDVEVKQRIEIINTLGKIVYSSTFNKKQNINVSIFAKGIYLIKISSDNLNIVKRFIKQ